MLDMTNAIRGTIPITMFNRGMAGKIFEDVKRTGSKVVMKNNTAECVLISPEEYLRIMDELEDAKLLAIAEERMEHYDPAKTIAAEDLYRELGITEADLADYDEVELE